MVKNKKNYSRYISSSNTEFEIIISIYFYKDVIHNIGNRVYYWGSNMDLNKKFVAIGLTLLIFSWVGNIFFYEKHIIKEPIFIKQYYDLQARISNVRLYYIQDINSKDQVESIIFPELGQDSVNFTENDISNDKLYYKFKCVYVNFYNGNENKIPDNLKNKVITKAKITFTNGKVIDEDIGKIYISFDDISKPALISEGSTSSGNNTGFSNRTAKKDTKIIGLQSRFSDIIKDAVEIKVNKKPVKDIKFPLELKAGDKLEVSYGFKFNKDDMRRNSVYDFPIDILTEDTDGTKGHSLCFIRYWMQFPDEYDIQSLKIDRR